MQIKDVVNLAGVIVSAFAACIAAYVARTAVDSQRNSGKWSTNHGLMAPVLGMLAEYPELLRLHFISEDDLKADGISLAEFNYVHLHMDAGSAYHHVSGEKLYQLTEYRQIFLRNPKVRFIWKKYLRGRFFSHSPYAASVDAYIAKIESEEPNLDTSIHIHIS